jgi:hypothetical protein
MTHVGIATRKLSAKLFFGSRYIVKSKPGRSFTRDKQEYRAKTRGLKKKRRGRPSNQTTPFVPFARENAAPETVRYSDGYTYVLS